MSPVQRLFALVEGWSGISLERGGTIESLVRFLGGRARELGLPSLEAYVAELEGSLASERELILDAVTVNYTWFFRDAEQLEDVGTLLREAWPHGARLNAWVAGCASGEDAYTLAMVAQAAGRELTVLGTDVNSACLAVAREGRYGAWSMRELPVEARAFFEAEARGTQRVTDALLARVSFLRHNLLDPPPRPPAGGWDLVLCRNVLIYFRRDLARAASERLGASLALGGWLLFGASEALLEEPVGLTLVRRRGRGALHRPAETLAGPGQAAEPQGGDHPPRSPSGSSLRSFSSSALRHVARTTLGRASSTSIAEPSPAGVDASDCRQHGGARPARAESPPFGLSAEDSSHLAQIRSPRAESRGRLTRCGPSGPSTQPVLSEAEGLGLSGDVSRCDESSGLSGSIETAAPFSPASSAQPVLSGAGFSVPDDPASSSAPAERGDLKLAAAGAGRPRSALALVEAGDALLSTDRLGAAARFAEAIEVDPLCLEAHLHLGIALHLQGDAEAAVTALRAALLLDGGLWPAAFYLALSFETLGQSRDALREYQRVLATNDAPVELAVRGAVGDVQTWRSDVLGLAKRRATALRKASSPRGP